MDIYRNICTISSDTRSVSKIPEIHLFFRFCGLLRNRAIRPC
ncbi:type II restriction endonuclease [Chlorobium limicola]